jgi:crotonobetainyl-CoA:carnitine CoA-transferase CaiB-like acyl-CoA transferase
MVEAEFGLMHLTGTRDGPPVKVGVAVTDLTTGLYACNSIMAALLARANTGEGQHLDVCLSDCQVATLANMGESVLISGKKDSGRWGTAHRKQFASLFLDRATLSNIWGVLSIRRAISRIQNRRWRYLCWRCK